MKPPRLSLFQKIVLSLRPIIECAIDSLKNDAYLVHTRHRTIFANVFASIAAYQLLIDKPNANFEQSLVDNYDLAHALGA